MSQQLSGTIAGGFIPVNTWVNLGTLLKGTFGYTGKFAVAELLLGPVGTIRTRMWTSNSSSPPGGTFATTAGPSFGVTGVCGKAFEWNYGKAHASLDLGRFWIFGDGNDIEFQVTGSQH